MHQHHTSFFMRAYPTHSLEKVHVKRRKKHKKHRHAEKRFKLPLGTILEVTWCRHVSKDLVPTPAKLEMFEEGYDVEGSPSPSMMYKAGGELLFLKYNPGQTEARRKRKTKKTLFILYLDVTARPSSPSRYTPLFGSGRVIKTTGRPRTCMCYASRFSSSALKKVLSRGGEGQEEGKEGGYKSPCFIAGLVFLKPSQQVGHADERASQRG
ncbi:hypothetical protein B0T26DRAFT_232216 [Lasiosphaeria miniovina]|uniref:Uncharacterized protein n=1 Tax=Lasiosphaeria miniovina TaxID=1954250 RepID=A0AA40E3J6_9PEZI|nr:uncharacterized protein B0T26DRAFT_232216 [Lasiosphaeria miniovina]KAK0722766.1 hypothetical protein B0T26DRAFT_232216 [Lasiosphaeria miniovina]